MEVIAIIIARGGSKRVPRKNVQPICGLPLVAWSVVQAVCSRSVNHVYLSTDDDEIADIGEIYGAEIIRRPDWPDADQASGNRPFRHAIEVLKDRHGMDYCMVMLMPTSPQRLPDDIDRGVESWRRTGGHMVSAVRRREMFIGRDLSGIGIRLVLTDKAGAYLEPCGGLVNIWEPAPYELITGSYESDHDDDINAQRYAGNTIESVDMYWYECQPWQKFETDTPVEFELTEQIFERFVLKGRGTDIYYEYAEAK